MTKLYWKFLTPNGATEHEGKEFFYNLPRVNEKWSEPTYHPEPYEGVSGDDCGPGRLHLMCNFDASYAPTNWWPWAARPVGNLVSESDEKIGARGVQLRRVSKKAFCRMIRLGWMSGADLRWADLRRANLREADLSGADLCEADLSGANLGRADLSWANLGRADLSGANLREADLSGANLSGANLRGANLRGANLREADLRGADLRWADLRRADLRWADLSWAIISDEQKQQAVL